MSKRPLPTAQNFKSKVRHGSDQCRRTLRRSLQTTRAPRITGEANGRSSSWKEPVSFSAKGKKAQGKDESQAKEGELYPSDWQAPDGTGVA